MFVIPDCNFIFSVCYDNSMKVGFKTNLVVVKHNLSVLLCNSDLSKTCLNPCSALRMNIATSFME